jgi:hypothetical protein
MADRKEDMKQYKKQYYINNKEKIKQQQKQYKLNNKEQQKQYKLDNKDKIKEQVTEYRQTYNGKKSYRISNWKQSGVISDDFNELYEKYINTTNCEECNVELIHGMFGNNKKCLDHDHETGQFRNILCCGCNLRRG